MISSYTKDFLREIKHTAGRFISLLFISALGVAIYVGVSFAPPDMRNTANAYFDEQNLMDLKCVSTIGFDDAAIDRLSELAQVRDIDAAYSRDYFVLHGEESVTVRLYSTPGDVNKLLLMNGRFAESDDECVVEGGLLWRLGLSIGDVIEITSENEGEVEYTLERSEYTIVGTVRTPMFVSFDKGSTSIGSGQVDAFIFTSSENFKLPVYTAVYITAADMPYDSFGGEYADKLDVLKEKIEVLGDELNTDIPGAAWYVFDRSVNAGYAGFEEDTMRLKAIAAVFPIIFFLVAALVGLTSMTRMVEEHRSQIGTYKALGYRTPSIVWKYVGYAFLASLVGSGVGLAASRFSLPSVIFNAYRTLYMLPDTVYSKNPGFMLAAAGAAVGSVVGVTLIACLTELRASPAYLMRPRPPAKGQRILLERIGIIWKNLSFSGKVTMRNLMRYKQRFFMTVFGIAGCTALLITGFGLRDSIGDIGNLQFTKITDYDAQVVFNEMASAEKLEEIDGIIDDDTNVISRTVVRQQALKAYGASNAPLDVYCVVTENSGELGEYMLFRERKSKNAVEFADDGVIITEKMSTILGLEKGDILRMMDDDNNSYEIEITGVIEYYINHYVYMNSAVYELIFGHEPAMNTHILKFADNSDDAQSPLVEKLLSKETVRQVVLTTRSINSIVDMVDVTNFVVYVLIIAAGGLALTVLFNLTTINIAERERELATIKVLGFYPGEMAGYIYRENAIITLIGILTGCVFGKFLHLFVVTSAEVELVMFGRDIHLASYLLSAVITVVFAALVNVIMLRKLTGIDMIESLKSVE